MDNESLKTTKPKHRFQPGQSGNPNGRPKGVPNKFTGNLRQAVLAPFDPEKFNEWVQKREEVYYTQLINKLLPRDVNMRVIQSIEDLTDEEKVKLLESLELRLGLSCAQKKLPEPEKD